LERGNNKSYVPLPIAMFTFVALVLLFHLDLIIQIKTTKDKT